MKAFRLFVLFRFFRCRTRRRVRCFVPFCSSGLFPEGGSPGSGKIGPCFSAFRENLDVSVMIFVN